MTTTTKAANATESVRLIDIDLAKQAHENKYGFRIRCRACMVDKQANLPSHAVAFMKEHGTCEQKPNL